MVDPFQDADDSRPGRSIPPDAVDLIEGQGALIQLSVGHAQLDDGVHHLPNAGQGGLSNGLGGRFDGLAQHEDARFLGVGFGAGVAESIFFHPVRAAVIADGLLIKIFSPGGAMVHGNEVGHRLGQTVFLGQAQSLLDVGDHHLGAQMGGNGIMRVFHTELVLDKVLGPGELADVMVIGSHPAEQTISPNYVGRRLRQVPHDNAVAEGAISLPAETPKQGMVEIGQFQQGKVGGHAENDLQYADEAIYHDRR